MQAQPLFGQGRAARETFALLATDPERELHTREIARRIRMSTHPVHRALGQLEASGLVTSRHVGRIRLWRAEREHPLYGPLRELLSRTSGIADLIRRQLMRIPRVDVAFIFGSYARGDQRGRSDIDVFVLGRPPR